MGILMDEISTYCKFRIRVDHIVGTINLTVDICKLQVPESCYNSKFINTNYKIIYTNICIIWDIMEYKVKLRNAI